MTEWSVYKLAFPPGSGVHFGRLGMEREESAEAFPSDSMFSALVSTLAYVSGPEEVVAWTKPFAEGLPPFLLSSAFPRAGDVLLLPMPLLIPKPSEGGEAGRRSMRKQLKRLRYVSHGVFQLILQGVSLEDISENSLPLQNGQTWIREEEVEALPKPWANRSPSSLRSAKVWNNSRVPRVTLDRMSNRSLIYQMGRVTFAEGCGLWLAVEWRDKDPVWRESFEALLTHLGDQGLGGGRSVGYGGFAWESGLSPDLPPAEGHSGFLTLSRYHPTLAELEQQVLGHGGAYQLTSVGGWFKTPGISTQRRKSLRLAIEGSALRQVGKGPWGDLSDVQPEYEAVEQNVGHSIWRYGYAMPIGVDLAEPGGGSCALM